MGNGTRVYDDTVQGKRTGERGEWGGEREVVLVRYSIYRSIAILVNVRYRYLVVSRYCDISNIE